MSSSLTPSSGEDQRDHDAGAVLAGMAMNQDAAVRRVSDRRYGRRDAGSVEVQVEPDQLGAGLGSSIEGYALFIGALARPTRETARCGRPAIWPSCPPWNGYRCQSTCHFVDEPQVDDLA